jgi:hypothetical protein
MDARRWIELAMVLILGMLIGYLAAHSTRTVPTTQFVVSHRGENGRFLYRYDVHTGKTWLLTSDESNYGWMEVPETNQSLSLPKK